MREIGIIIILIFFSGTVLGQNPKGVNKQKGFLFISAYNYRYDWNGEHTRPLGFHDFFFPGQNFVTSSKIKTTIFTDGIRVDSIPQRFYVKNKSLKVFGIDTSQCYKYDSFYVVPVQISYREIEEYKPLVCLKVSFLIQQGPIQRIIEYDKRAMVITEILLYPDEKKKYERL